MVEVQDYQTFFKIQRRLDTITSTQSKGWHNYKKSQGRDIRYFVNDEAQPKLAVWGFLFKVPVLRKFLFVIEGMAHAKALKDMEITTTFSELVEEHDFIGIEIDSNTIYNASFEIGLRRAGFIRPLGLFNCPLTLDIDLTQELRFNRNWRRNLKRSLSHNLKFEEKITCTSDDIKAIVDMYSEMNTLKGLDGGLQKSQIEALTSADDIRVFFVYDESGCPLCARIIHCNNHTATDIFAANTKSSRDCGASYLIVQKLLETLKSEGYKIFDFGRIGPSTHSSDSVYTYKRASRGEEVQYLGEFSFYKNKLVELLVLLYKLRYKSPRF